MEISFTFYNSVFKIAMHPDVHQIKNMICGTSLEVPGMVPCWLVVALPLDLPCYQFWHLGGLLPCLGVPSVSSWISVFCHFRQRLDHHEVWLLPVHVTLHAATHSGYLLLLFPYTDAHDTPVVIRLCYIQSQSLQLHVLTSCTSNVDKHRHVCFQKNGGLRNEHCKDQTHASHVPPHCVMAINHDTSLQCHCHHLINFLILHGSALAIHSASNKHLAFGCIMIYANREELMQVVGLKWLIRLWGLIAELCPDNCEPFLIPYGINGGPLSVPHQPQHPGFRANGCNLQHNSCCCSQREGLLGLKDAGWEKVQSSNYAPMRAVPRAPPRASPRANRGLLGPTTLFHLTCIYLKSCQYSPGVFTSNYLPQLESHFAIHIFMDPCFCPHPCYSLVNEVPLFLVLSLTPHAYKSCTIDSAVLQWIKLCVSVGFSICSRVVICMVTSVRNDCPQPQLQCLVVVGLSPTGELPSALHPPVSNLHSNYDHNTQFGGHQSTLFCSCCRTLNMPRSGSRQRKLDHTRKYFIFDTPYSLISLFSCVIIIFHRHYLFIYLFVFHFYFHSILFYLILVLFYILFYLIRPSPLG
ncbi:hypothetical protein VP01_60g5 [Puccinia sorghi]|uniref:Uncharacterized protein n=1 Tax=Puccinia sorghi TaxID=27349 RepID=A0A0L6UH49_9BASI|nr:hypothetical protein VP01_60g5 [Puccinia sorghi]